jgi:hypothetical protein
MRSRVLGWLLVALLWAAALWSTNLTLYNWWAAGGPPMPDSSRYAYRGDIFCAVSILLLVAGGFVTYSLLRRSKDRAE